METCLEIYTVLFESNRLATPLLPQLHNYLSAFLPDRAAIHAPILPLSTLAA